MPAEGSPPPKRARHESSPNAAPTPSNKGMLPPAPPTPPQRRVFPSPFYVEPFLARSLTYDDETSAVQRLASTACDTPGAELEVRLGKLVHISSNERLQVQSVGSSFVFSGKGYKFDAGVSEEGFYRLNQHLNRLAEKCHAKGTMRYTKSRTRDFFLPSPSGSTSRPLRVTVGADDVQVRSCVAKAPCESTDVSSPLQAWDRRWRTSVEEPREAPDITDPQVWRQVTMIRVKERRTYTFGCFSVELTCVESAKGPFQAESAAALDLTDLKLEATCEVEMEIDVKALRVERGLPLKESRFGELCRLFVENLRGLAAVASDIGHVAPVGQQLDSKALISVKSRRAAAAGKLLAAARASAPAATSGERGDTGAPQPPSDSDDDFA